VTDTGECLLPVEDEGMSYAGASLLEPWGCVLAAYTQRRRLVPKADGVMWILGQPGDETAYQFSQGFDAPAKVILTDVPQAVKLLVQQKGLDYEVRDGLSDEEFAELSERFTDGNGFDDIVVLDPRSAKRVSAAAKVIARRGTMNLVGKTPLDGLVELDLSRLHYDYISFMGNQTNDIAASYGEQRNRCELRGGGLAVMIGAGGPMGQMHVQRAIEQPDGPATIIATEVNASRLETLQDRFVPLAEAKGKTLEVVNPAKEEGRLNDLVMKFSDGRGADDVVVCVPVAQLMAEGSALMNSDGMLVLFAGVASGTMAPLDLSRVYLHNAQYTGTSGLTIEDQKLVLDRARENALSPELSVAAIGGMKTVKKAYQALIDGRFPGKIVIYPQFDDLPLLGLDELAVEIPEVAAKLGPGNSWTLEAEKALFAYCLSS
ncbi:MAG: zinc-binding dehydrogenase, partial [Anaerolineaceae bacterium]|nr:zinc-binding dehydrogenase [Anaerolineaceae bacterium]